MVIFRSNLGSLSGTLLTELSMQVDQMLDFSQVLNILNTKICTVNYPVDVKIVVGS